jgi:ferritin-like metal-binding protein YciE
LHESLQEEKAADALLTQLAKAEVNQDALAT